HHAHGGHTNAPAGGRVGDAWRGDARVFGVGGLRPGWRCAAKLAAPAYIRVVLFADALRDYRHRISACGPHPRHRHGSRVTGCARFHAIGDIDAVIMAATPVKPSAS